MSSHADDPRQPRPAPDELDGPEPEGAGGQPLGFDLGGMLEQVQALQQQMVEAQEANEARIVTGSAGGGKVTVQATGAGDFRDVTIDPEVVDPDDVTMLEDLVLAAVRDAMTQINEGMEDTVGGFDLPDLGDLANLPGLGGLGGLLGGASSSDDR